MAVNLSILEENDKINKKILMRCRNIVRNDWGDKNY